MRSAGCCLSGLGGIGGQIQTHGEKGERGGDIRCVSIYVCVNERTGPQRDMRGGCDVVLIR